MILAVLFSRARSGRAECRSRIEEERCCEMDRKETRYLPKGIWTPLYVEVRPST
jgi:hypothetical protein